MGHGVASDTYSFWDQSSEEMLAKGNGGMRQMYNYSTIDYSNTGKIENYVAKLLMSLKIFSLF
jgi:hypothetical protein